MIYEKNIITTESPLGYTVYCSQNKWDNHVLKNHPITKDKEGLVKKAIESPLAIFQSDGYNNRDVYFGDFGNNNKSLYTKVIVQNNTNNYCSVVTAFPQKGITGNINPGVCKYVKPKL